MPNEIALSKRIVMLSAGLPSTLWVTTLAPVVPKMTIALAHNATDQLLIKMVLTAPGIAMVVGAPLAGYLADRIGRARLLTWSTAVWVLFGAMGYVLDDLIVLVASRLVVGLASAAIVTAGVAMIGDVRDGDARKRLMGGEVAIAGVASIVVYPIAGMLGDIYWRLPFLLSLALLPLAVLARYSLKNEWVWHPSAQAARRSADTAGDNRMPWGLVAVGFLAGAANFGAITYMPFLLQSLGITSASMIGSALTAQTLATVVIAGFFGYARRYLSSSMTFSLGFLVAGAGLAIAALSQTYILAVVALFVIGWGAGWVAPNMSTRAAEVATLENRGRVVGLVKSAYMAASSVMVVAFDPIFRSHGARGVLFFCTLLCFVMSFIYLLLIWKNRAASAPQLN
jgi:MFS family permease